MKKKLYSILLMKNNVCDNDMKEIIEDTLDIDKTKFEIVIDRENPTYVICTTSVFVWENAYIEFKRLFSGERIKILIVDEAMYPDLNLFDYVIMFMDSHLVCDDRICVKPHSLLYRNLENNLYNANKKDLTEELFKKEKFCNFLYSNGNAHPMRDKLFYAISEYKTVEAIGKHLNNVGGYNGDRSVANWYDRSVEKKSHYKFTIAAENALFPGYTSEKMITSFQAHSIPIYWGNPNVTEIYNQEAFIYVNKYDSLTDLVDEIKRIDQDDELWLEMVSKPWQTDVQKECEKDKIDEYHSFVEHMFEQERGGVEKAHRIPEGTQMSAYTNHWFYPNRWGEWLYTMNRRSCTIFGCGEDGQDCLKNLMRLGIDVECFYDNDPNKHGLMHSGVAVRSFDEWVKGQKFIIVASSSYEEAIFKQIEAAGAKAGVDYASYGYIRDMFFSSNVF